MARPQNLAAREQILRTAFELFHEWGYKGVSMEDIASKIGMKKANLFHYYPTKDELGVAVVDSVVHHLQEMITKQFENGNEPVKTIERIFSDSLKRMKQQGCCKGCFVGNLAQEISDQNEKLRRRVSDHMHFWVNQTAAYLARHRANGYFRKEMNAKQSARAILALLEGALLFAKANKQVHALRDAQAMAVSYLKALRK